MLVKCKSILFLISLSSGFIFNSSLVFAEQLKADQVKALFTDKTSYAYHEKRDFDITSYYSSDGKLVSIRNGEKWTGKWRIKADGKHCIQLNDPYSGVAKIDKCMVIQNDAGTYKRFKIKRNGELKHIITYKRFAEGNPENL